MSRRILAFVLLILSASFQPISEASAHATGVTHVYGGQSLQNAVNAADSGDTIVVHAGSYSDVSLTGKHWSPSVRVMAAAGDHVVVSGFWMLDTTGLIISGFDVPGQIQARQSGQLEFSDNRVGQGVRIRDDMFNVDILRNHITGGQYGIWIYNSISTGRNRNIRIAGNDVHDQLGDNIQIGAADNLLIEDNVLHDIPDNVDHNDGIQLMGSEGAIIRRNRFWNHDQALLLKAEPYLGPSNRVANVRVENNIAFNERGAGFIAANSVDAELVNNTLFDNHFADIHIEGTNPGLKIWNNVLRQIWKGGAEPPALEDFNCGASIYQPGPNTIIATPQFAPNSSYRLIDGSPCLTLGRSAGAPAFDIAGQARTGYVAAGAWQTSGGAGPALPPPAPSAPAPAPQTPAKLPGYWIARANGETIALGGAPKVTSPGFQLNSPMVGGARAPSGNGYWLVARDGGVFTVGDAPFLGSTGNIKLNQPIVGMTATPSGAGYWFVASDGGIFAYGDAAFYGSMGGRPLNQPIVGMAASPTGRGYWLVASDGGIFAFGDAAFYGSTGSLKLNKAIVAMAAAPDGRGYWFTASDGGVFSFGSARFFGSTGGISLAQSVVSITPTATGKGYWLVASDGGVFAFGDATFLGSGVGGRHPVVTVISAS